MATPQDAQTALDFIRSVNICRNLFNMTAKMARGEIPKIEGIGPAVEEVPMTLAEINEGVSRQMDNIAGYTQQATRYLGVAANEDQAARGLEALGLDLATVQADMQAFDEKIGEVRAALPAATTKQSLDAIGDDIDSDILPLNLLRNA